MRITNSMIRNDVLWSINKNESLMQKYQTQLSSGKKIQKPSEDPIIAVRSLKFRTTLREIDQYRTNNDDAYSWLSVSEQAMDNTLSMLQRARELSVQAASDIYNTEDRANVTAELKQLQTQIFNEANVNYAGRYVFSGFKTDQPVTYTEDQADTYEITEHITADDLTYRQVVDGEDVLSVPRFRLGYSNVGEAAAPVVPSNIPAPYTLVATDSSGTSLVAPNDNPYEPPVDTIYFLQDTGELIFNQDNVDGTAPAAAFPANIDFTYEKGGLVKGDLNPQMFFESVNQTTGVAYTPPTDEMVYQISYNQDITVNSNAHQVFSHEMFRDFEEVIQSIGNIPEDDSIEQSMMEDILGDVFKELMGKMDDHINDVVVEQAAIGSKVNRLDLTIQRLDDDYVNFTELMSQNEDVDMADALVKMQAQELIYTASLQASTTVLQKSLLDFLR